MNKSIICVWGYKIYGKSSSVKCVYDELKSKGVTDVSGMLYNRNSLPWLRNNSELLAMVDYTGIKIGIESQNDYGGIQKNTIRFLAGQGCDIIVCASKSWGSTVRLVEKIAKKNGYEIFWMSPFYNDPSNQKTPKKFAAINTQTAKSIVNFIDGLINGSI